MNRSGKLIEMEKKDVVYSLRMSSAIRKMLNVAARNEKRSLASLLNAIIMDYLQQHGYFNLSAGQSDRRQAIRKKIHLPAFIFQTGTNGKTEHFPCLIKDLSIGGLLIHMPKNKRFKMQFAGEVPSFTVNFVMPDGNEMVEIDCRLRHIRESDSRLLLGCNIEVDEEEDIIRIAENF